MGDVNTRKSACPLPNALEGPLLKDAFVHTGYLQDLWRSRAIEEAWGMEAVPSRTLLVNIPTGRNYARGQRELMQGPSRRRAR